MRGDSKFYVVTEYKNKEVKRFYISKYWTMKLKFMRNYQTLTNYIQNTMKKRVKTTKENINPLN